ncbi:hypothetical protein DES43_1545 [Aquamicrobium defluvii]|uniref:Uncharacterized protein n=1 Tax=Aquamicrobium defluvii TaxID=69279 RepID=A0A4R6Y6W0_9HYPH|nr:hypothetical protein DES43_1545 [Aquamicrobium defluvii]
MRTTDVLFFIIWVGSFAFFAGVVVGDQGWLAP